MRLGLHTGNGSSADYAKARADMVETQIRHRKITDPRLLACIERIPRHEFVPLEFQARAYEDGPLPIGEGQTISQPYIVAAMTAALHLQGNERVLEIGTGLGYQAAVLSHLAREVFTVEYRPNLARQAAERLARLGYQNVHVHCDDGTLGLPAFAPYDAILVAAAAPAVPAPLVAQLAALGRLVVPVGSIENQDLQLVHRDGSDFSTTVLEPCRFVPLVGTHGWKEVPEL